MHIAWVDDEPIVRNLAQKVLTRCGATTAGFADHASLLAVAQETPFDAAILQPQDHVPALEALDRLRDGGTRLVFLVTALSPEHQAGIGIPISRFDGFLQKPFTPDQVITLLGLTRPARKPAATG